MPYHRRNRNTARTKRFEDAGLAQHVGCCDRLDAGRGDLDPHRVTLSRAAKGQAGRTPAQGGNGFSKPEKARFEVEGADLAAALLTEHGCDRATVDGVWEAIALHTSGGIAERRGALCYLVRSGVGADFGRNADFIDEQIATAIHRRYPRLAMASTLVAAIVAHARRNPEAAPPYSMPGELLREQQTGGASLLELMASHGRWGE
ncbi:hypothetical protein MSG_01465 [Mycobacterium shigaense]|uniref:Uncharacterized protein n=1 Tax=Mycobacterium shigaense TaxID=722731 RepID=A0A1Z4EF73_9MYCO|nr:hypothetical protein MSG_01465 [Mycobacterium shigaense]